MNHINYKRTPGPEKLSSNRSLSSLIGNTGMMNLTDSIPVIQRTKITAGELEELLYHCLHQNGISDELQAAYNSLDEDDDQVITYLIGAGVLANDTYEVVNAADMEDESGTYGVLRSSQFLNPSILRRALGGIGAGGEAHHLIPSCVVAVLPGKDADKKHDFNQDWNGILLPGSKKQGEEINPLHSSSASLPYHRNNGARDHPTYTQKVKDKLAVNRNYQQVANELRAYITGKHAGDTI